MRNPLSHLAVTGLMLVALSAPALADRDHRCPGGGEMPGPFGDANMRVELADGELYTLEGRVVVVQSGGELVAYLQVDLEKHPWLANKIRQQQPYYALKGNISFWRQLHLTKVRVTVEADAQVVGSGLAISLKPLAVVRL